MTTETPIYFDLLTPELETALTRPRWSYAAALKAADEAIAARKPKRPAKKAAARKGASS